MKFFNYLVIAVVLGVVVFGFTMIGAPGHARKLRFDEARINNLQNIQNEVIYYWQKSQKLPETISALGGASRYGQVFTVPVDPATGKEYVYKVNGPEEFMLCATFDLSSEDPWAADRTVPKSGYEYESWDHDAGSQCFTRRINKELYKPITSPEIIPPGKY